MIEQEDNLFYQLDDRFENTGLKDQYKVRVRKNKLKFGHI